MDNPNLNTKTVLVVEDDPDLQTIAVEKLKQGGLNVMRANNGVEGLDAALKNHPDLILLDVMMPQMNGLEMLAELRKDEWGKKVHVFMLTSMNRSKEMSEGMRYNVAKYIIKSDVKYDNLVADINQYLQ
jgi:CheY-like chemotaxis protein